MDYSITPYEGNEPYIFVSYSHSDTAKIMPVLEALESRGFRIWFDRGIEPGSEWTESIAEHLSACTVCMAFISHTFAQSMNCRQEIGYAVKQKKKILAVFLENADLSMGLDMQLSAYQQIFAHQYLDKNHLYSRLESLPILQICRQSAPKEPRKAKERKRRKPGRKRIVLLASILTAVAIACAAAWLLPTLSQRSPYHVVFTAHADCTAQEFADAAELLKGRLDAFSGGARYNMKVKDNMIDLMLPRELFGSSDLEAALSRCFAGACEFSLAQKNTDRHIPLSREDMESIRLKSGTIPGVDAEALGIQEEPYPYIEITLTGECIRRISGETAAWGDDLVFAADKLQAGETEFPACPAADGRTFRLPMVSDQLAETLVYTLNHDPYAHPFSFEILKGDFLWENPSAEDAGRNQCDGNAFTESTVVVPFSGNLATGSTLTKNERVNALTIFKARLDCLEQPYAIGFRDDDPGRIYARTTLDHMGPEIIALLGSNTKGMYMRTSGVHDFITSDWMEIAALPDERYGLLIRLNSSDYAQYQTIAAHNAENGGEVTLVMEDIPLGTARLYDESTRTLILDSLTFKPDGVIREEDLWILQLMQCLLDGSYLKRSFFDEDPYFLPGKSDPTPTADDFGTKCEQLVAQQEQFRRTVTALYPDADVSFEDTDAKVSLRLDIDSTLPQQSTTIARTIYETTDFENSLFTRLALYPANENLQSAEGCRITFYKHYSNLSDEGDPFAMPIRVRGIFEYGRLAPYAEAFREIVFSDPFYTEKTFTEDDWKIQSGNS